SRQSFPTGSEPGLSVSSIIPHPSETETRPCQHAENVPARQSNNRLARGIVRTGIRCLYSGSKDSRRERVMGAILAALYSAVVYLAFLATFLYAIGFVEGVVVPKTIDSGPVGPVPISILINAVLLTIFALQHS